MSIHAIHSSSPAYVPPTAASGAVLGTTPAGGPTSAAEPPSGTSVSKPHNGDGPIFASLKASLSAAGFTPAGSAADPGADHTQMHAFTQAFFQAVHDQKAADVADGSLQKGDHAVNMQTAIAQVQAQAAAGNASPELQAAFAALQQTQPAGSAASTATLASVLSGVSNSAADMSSPVGTAVDTTA